MRLNVDFAVNFEKIWDAYRTDIYHMYISQLD